MRIRSITPLRRLATAMLLAAFSLLTARAQERVKSLPGHEQYLKVEKASKNAVKGGAVVVTWKDGGSAFEFRRGEKAYRYDVATNAETEIANPKRDPEAKGGPGGPGGRRGGGGGGGGPGRGRQSATAASPDGALKAFYRDRNLWLADAKGIFEMPITADAGEKNRLKYGSASWVYGEELAQRSAIWWSPDSAKVAFYRFDESQVKDYFLALGQTDLQDKLDAEPYPKAGALNPVADIAIYDVASKKTTVVDVRDGRPFADDVVGHYAYGVSWSADGKELLFHRTNRDQKVLEFAAADRSTGKCRVVFRDEWLPSWVDNSPPMQFLKDGRQFVLISGRTGWKNLYLGHLDGRPLTPITHHEFDVGVIVRIDEQAGNLFYMAHDGDNPMKLQLHRVGLDGTGEVRLTDPAFHHAVDIAPDGKRIIDIAQAHDQPPVTRLLDAGGKVLAEIAKSDRAKFDELGLKAVESFTFKAADGTTDLYGLLHRPTTFDPAKKYPLLVSVYAGPKTNGARETFVTPSALAEYGFLVASFDSRSADGRGKRFLDAIYKKLGITEVDDQAAGVKSLGNRPYVDLGRVGIYGTSYGGTVSAMCLLRYPDVFQAACASSAVTDFRLYDTIYTERYMGKPQDNAAAYDAASCVKNAGKLKGKLMIYFGTADNNVHPSNSLQFIRELQKAGKSFEVQVGPDAGHSGLPTPRMVEFFTDSLRVR